MNTNVSMTLRISPTRPSSLSGVLQASHILFIMQDLPLAPHLQKNFSLIKFKSFRNELPSLIDSLAFLLFLLFFRLLVVE